MRIPIPSAGGALAFGVIALTASLNLSLPVNAGERIYRVIDAAGNVTFTDVPPPGVAATDVTPITLPAGPTPAQQRAAEERIEAIRREAESLAAERARASAERHQEVSAAEQELAAARAALAEAEVQGSGDWQTLVTGGRVPSAAYRQRVEAARARVAEAERAVRSAGGQVR
ncbi:MAG: DUF4124 domain-containing protein [Chromatiaceae bacterium]|nr:MAG: DUF4124 domain-containing protein [Chromatiaceae bacterium]